LAKALAPSKRKSTNATIANFFMSPGLYSKWRHCVN